MGEVFKKLVQVAPLIAVGIAAYLLALAHGVPLLLAWIGAALLTIGLGRLLRVPRSWYA